MVTTCIVPATPIGPLASRGRVRWREFHLEPVCRPAEDARSLERAFDQAGAAGERRRGLGEAFEIGLHRQGATRSQK